MSLHTHIYETTNVKCSYYSNETHLILGNKFCSVKVESFPEGLGMQVSKQEVLKCVQLAKESGNQQDVSMHLWPHSTAVPKWNLRNDMKNSSRYMQKYSFWYADPTKTHISLRIRAVLSESFLSTWRHFAALVIQKAPNSVADLNLRRAHISELTFSDVAAQRGPEVYAQLSYAWHLSR